MAFCSDEIQEITGFPASDFIGNSRRTFASIIHEDDRSGVAADVAAALSSGLPYTLEFRVVRADGAIRWVYEKGQGVRSPAGDHVWLDGAIFDITERTEALQQLRKSHTRLELAGLATGSAVYEWDLITRDTVWTESMTSTFGYPSEVIEPSYDWWRAHVHPEDRARVDARIHQCHIRPGHDSDSRRSTASRRSTGPGGPFSTEAYSSAPNPERRRTWSAP